MNNSYHKKVLVCPLDWGLGHATRCIPIIKELQARNVNVSIAGSGASRLLLKQEFPQLSFYELPSYAISYPERGNYFALKLIRQIPKILRTIREEKKVIERLIAENGFHFIISDNRYGCYHRKVRSVLVIHQTNLQLPFYLKLLGPLVYFFHTRSIQKFTECWIPDYSNHLLSGNLSKSSLPCRFVGPLSRFKSPTIREKKYAIAAILSGPEPQRTILENILTNELQNQSRPSILLQGLPKTEKLTHQIGNLLIVNHLKGEELQKTMEESETIICRSGYSSIMDLAKIGAIAILIPTPGQTEQEYLAQYLASQNVCFSMRQHEFNLEVALRESKKYKGFASTGEGDPLLSYGIDDWLK